MLLGFSEHSHLAKEVCLLGRDVTLVLLSLMRLLYIYELLEVVRLSAGSYPAHQSIS